jgi:hypothetical protein
MGSTGVSPVQIRRPAEFRIEDELCGFACAAETVVAVPQVSGTTPETTGGTPVLPKTKQAARIAPRGSLRFRIV